MTIAIVGRTGSGKTWAAKTIFEQEIDAGQRVCVIDPTGAHWGLRLTPDGKEPMFPVVIFGGEHGDVPITSDHGERLAEMIATGRVRQSVVDISEMTGGEQTRFLTAFFEALYAKNKGVLTLVMDEADMMAPQQPMPEQQRLKGAVNKIVRRGRIKGFRSIMITQRPAVLDKSVLSQIDTLIAMRLTSPQDRKAIEDWVKGNAALDQAKEVLGSLSGLPRGTGWIWAPAEDRLEKINFPMIRSYDSSRTPEQGEEIREVKPISDGNLADLRAIFSTSNEAEKTGKHARSGATSADLTAAEQRGYERGYADGVSAGRSHAAGLIRGDLAIFASTVGRLFDKTYPNSALDAATPAPPALLFSPGTACTVERAPAGASARPGGDEPPVFVRPRRLPHESLARAPRQSEGNTAPVGINGAARKMLAVIDTNPPVRRSWTQIATLAGLKARGGHFNLGRKQMLEGGLVDEANSMVAIVTPSAAATAPTSDPAALVEMWAANLSGAAPKILRAMFMAGGSCRRSEVAQSLGMKPTGGHWNAAWKELRDNDIVAVSGDVATLTELFVPTVTTPRPKGRGF